MGTHYAARELIALGHDVRQTNIRRNRHVEAASVGGLFSCLLEQFRHFATLAALCFVSCKEIDRRAPPRLVLVIDVSELLAVVVAHHKTGVCV
jgi:hypothetical protein